MYERGDCATCCAHRLTTPWYMVILLPATQFGLGLAESHLQAVLLTQVSAVLFVAHAAHPFLRRCVELASHGTQLCLLFPMARPRKKSRRKV